MNKVNQFKKQSGVSLMNFLVWLIAIGVIAGYGVQVGLLYMKKKSVSEAIDQTFAEVAKKDGATTRDVQGLLYKKLGVNSIEIKQDDLVITKEGSRGFRVNVNMSKEMKVGPNVTVIIDSSLEKVSP